jgi:acetylornithine deacetylase/succinyl-diaminopimelate desuccinylase-like protein
MDKVIDFINVNRDRYLDELKGLLAIPSISALPEHTADVRRCAEWCVGEMTRIGLENVRLLETPGNPSSTATGSMRRRADDSFLRALRRAAGRSVEPVGVAAIRGHVRDGEIYARGAADDKGQVFMHMKAVEAHMKQTGKLPVNIKFMIEGEEEVGSAHLDDFIRSHKNDLKADVVVISDSGMFARGVPSICYGLRASSTSRSICAAAAPICTRAVSAERSPIPDSCCAK